MPTIQTPAPPHTPCRLAHHNIGHRVTWTKGFTRLTGLVMGHMGERRWITVQLDDGTYAALPCGPVAKC